MMALFFGTDIQYRPIVFGKQVGNLTQIGGAWIDFPKVGFIEFSPADGCGAEIIYADGKLAHLTAYDKACLRSYLEQEGTAEEDLYATELLGTIG